MPITADTHVRLARPSRDLVMLGLPGAGWHLELVGGSTLAVEPRPTGEDLFVLYLDGPPDDELVPRIERAGGTRVSAGPYWDRWGVTFAYPDGYRLVLCTRAWSND
ncbi:MULTISPECIES: hypothetical protein [Micromonospora]|uniref:hypothetical protein n=1 Tax=Micromonospora TaxID=1873 RepID=UPI0007DAFBE5|nr:MULTISPECIES: hypothetical protein [unclassified Micromonospora]MBP1785852.1 hypothetical protein [Micromonospora sp. HB375]MDH6470108.1 hypothetical protein [Micromonospora sp. H404/HB375]